MESVNPLLELITSAALLGGGLWGLWGVITLAGGMRDHAGPQIQHGIWQIAGAALILAAAWKFSELRF